ncbi:MAG: glycoside hydrolase family 2 TIM barrel-domain containing protein [Deltaproteobacteria bacterium]
MKTLLTGLIVLCLRAASADAAVVIKGKKGAWSLEVDGAPFEIKGVGCGIARGTNGEDYLQMARDMGANVVRTWGTDQGTQEYLDHAAELGLKVIAGIWIDYTDEQGTHSYLGKKEHIWAKRREILSYVSRFRNHPAILMWGLGNEAIFLTKNEEERRALCGFLEEMVQVIHRVDPDHPVVYASASKMAFAYLAKDVPSLDVIGANEYASIRALQGAWQDAGFDKPYLVTEYGPYLSQARPRDVNRRASEQQDYQKALLYRSMTEQIWEFSGYNIGGVVFHLGETSQESMTWWNLNEGDKKRASYWTMYQLYTGQKQPCPCVRLRKLTLEKYHDVAPGQWIEARIWGLDDAQDKDVKYSYRMSTAREGILEYYVNSWVPVEVEGQGPVVRLRMPLKKGVYRVYGFAEKDCCIASASATVSVE